MATSSYHVSPPEPFTFSRPEEWQKWIRRFERFRQASGLSEKGEATQISTLIYSMGDEADDILRSCTLTEEVRAQYTGVRDALGDYFTKRRNVIFERARFNMRRQEPGESVDKFITSLYSLAEYCNYGTLHDEMIRDRIVVGISNTKLSEKLQLDTDLTLEKAVTQARQAEVVKRQQPLVRGEQGATLVGGVRGAQDTKSKNNGKPIPCARCGKSPKHDLDKCPARNAVCRKCKKRGHYQVVCRTGKPGRVQQVSEDTEEKDNDSFFLGAVGDPRPDDPWAISLHVNGMPVNFLIDTGAEVTLISQSIHRALGSPALTPSRKSLKGPSSDNLQVKGWFRGTIVNSPKQHEVEQDVYVVNQLSRCLLGQPAIKALDLVTRVRGVTEASCKVIDEFPQLFRGLGKIEGEYKIQLKDGAKPYALTTPRRVPIPLMKAVRKELQRMEDLGVIVPVTEPTDWCSGMVVVPKKSNEVRICVDLTQLNRSVKRERHLLPAVDQSLAQLAGAKVFTKLDANSGFWQIPLSAESVKLTTFITPFGRFCFHRLPFGITSAPEHFQRRMSEILYGIEGVVCMIDDILIHGESQSEHDDRLRRVLQRLEEAGVTLNRQKCISSVNEVTFLGQIIGSSGVRPDPAKVAAIVNMPAPTDVPGVRRFLGIVNQMSKFIPNIAEITHPLRELLVKNRQWTWAEPQIAAFRNIKQILATCPVIALFDSSRETIVAADASSYGLGAVLLQRQPSGECKPVAYVSRSMTSTEMRYAQIEKEALAFTWACERLSDYLIGLPFHILTDHKPLVPLFSTKKIDELPIRVQRFRLRMLRFDFSISHVPGKQLVTADALSRSPVVQSLEESSDLSNETDFYVHALIDCLPISEQRLENLRQQQEEDEVCQEVTIYCQSAWPERKRLSKELLPYYQVRSEISVAEGLLMRQNRLIIPVGQRTEVLERIHEGHQGISKCRKRASQSVWWPGLSQDVEHMVSGCTECCKARIQHPQPLLTSPLPDLPWQKVGTDLFEWNKAAYLLIVDYYSRYIEIAKLSRPTAEQVIEHSKSIFARHGIPEVVISDNGPQYSSQLYSEFAKSYQFQHVTSSPYFPQSNGEAERAVGTVKQLLNKEKDPYLAIMAYRATPLQNGYSPSELLMSRRLRTTVPVSRGQREPKLVDVDSLIKRDQTLKRKQKEDFDKRHAVQELSELDYGDVVWVPDHETQAVVGEQVAPRSYEIVTSNGTTTRRNRQDLISLPEDNHIDKACETRDSPSANPRRKSTRKTRPPVRYDPSWT